MLGRFLRHIAAVHILEETGPDTWKLTPFSRAMGDGVSYLDQTVQCGYVTDDLESPDHCMYSS